MIVTMDISNAFNTIKEEAIRKELEEAGCPTGLRKLAENFLRERTAHCGGVMKKVITRLSARIVFRPNPLGGRDGSLV